jgi:hypothetical protein
VPNYTNDGEMADVTVILFALFMRFHADPEFVAQQLTVPRTDAWNCSVDCRRISKPIVTQADSAEKLVEQKGAET